MDRGFREDLRNGFFVAMITLTLFIVLLFQIGAKGGEHGYAFVQRLEAARQPAVRGAAEPPTHHNASEVPVLCHHFLRTNTTPVQFFRILGGLFLNLPLLRDMEVWSQSQREFEREMKYLYDQGYVTVSLNDLHEWRQGRKRLPEKSIVITFDDGDRSVLDIAFPILQKYGFRATLFIVTSAVGTNWDRVRNLSWDEITLLHESGVFDIGSHTHALHYKVDTPGKPLPVALGMEGGFFVPENGERWQTRVHDDLVASRRLIKANVGVDTVHLAWPYGGRSAATDSIAASAGFHSVSTLSPGMNELTSRSRPVAHVRDTYSFDSEPDDILNIGVPSFLPRHAARRFAWERHFVKRYTITARTSIRDFKQMLAE
jgi:peptidoglycan/xylan/chitin deacetylase (PgdA/CDA1 family)